jgi:hypothetical protein
MKQLDLLKYLIEKQGMNTSFCLKEPLYGSEQEGGLVKKEWGVIGHNSSFENSLTSKFWNSCLAMKLAINNKDEKMIEYLWNDHYYLWDISDLDSLVDHLYNTEFLDALHLILTGRAFKSII